MLLKCPQHDSHTMSPTANMVTTSLNHNITWYPDSTAPHHVTLDLTSMATVEPYIGNYELAIDDGVGLYISNICHSTLITPIKTFNLHYVLYVLDINRHLLSVKKSAKENNVLFEFKYHFLNNVPFHIK